MANRTRLGLVFLPTEAPHAVELLVRAEQAGVATAWLEMNAIGLDPLPLLAAAATQTERIGFGTAILPAFSRHPAALATQVLSLEGLAPGRLRLGIGAGNAVMMAEAFAHPSDRPLARLREYIRVLRPILHDGEVSFAGDFYSADVSVPQPPGTPVLLSALGPQAYALAGEMADGALSWLCPIDYLVDVASPAMAHAAAAARRAKPPLIAHVSIALGSGNDRGWLREAARQDLSRYARVPVFARMLAAAGYLIVNGAVTDDLLDELVIVGDEAEVTARLTRVLERHIDELMVSLIPETHDRDQENALLEILGAIASAT
jgi:alkanesulfonate monooxygenase SsuD/methylene tetrahydromethanopterin reductase-like flavin-dependent oxidoreductase (luciferase family)